MKALACSFCGKRQDEVMQLVASPPRATICDECALLAVEMICIEHPDWRDRVMRTLTLLPKRPGKTT
jgi:ATP-dependent protease Clp ATPase subunit